MPNSTFLGADSANVLSPPLSPGLNEIVRDADALLELMAREPLGVVADLANILTKSAHDAGAWEIEAAATNVRSIASSRRPVVLTGAMRALCEAIAHTESDLTA